VNPYNRTVIRHNLKTIPPAKDFLALREGNGFGRYIEHARTLTDWKKDPRTKSTWFSQKRRSAASAIKEFRGCYEPTEYYAEFGENDDTFQIFYRTRKEG
jgi:hypothetical protein